LEVSALGSFGSAKVSAKSLHFLT